MFNPENRHHAGFTIVELLIVIVVIGILAAIVIVAYTGVQNKANDSAVQSDFHTFNVQMGMYEAENSSYPIGWTTLPTVAGLKFSKASYQTSNNAVLYCAPADGSSYALVGKSKSGTVYTIGSASPSVKAVAISFPNGMAIDCPAVGSSSAGANWLHANGAWVSWVQ